MPPLLLDDDEAVAVAVSLRTAAGGAVDGIEETSLRALTKLQQVLPTRLAHRVDAVQTYTVRGGGAPRGPRVDSGLLATLAAAAREREIVRFSYSDHQGAASERRVEPYRLVNWGRRWYLVAFDVLRGDWRNFRVDRISDARSVGHRFAVRPLPDEDVAAYVSRGTRSVQMRFRATVDVDGPADEVAARMGGWHEGSVEALDDGRSRVRLGARSAEDLARWLVFLDADFEVVDSPELADAVRRLAERFARAVG
jgi:predicted DNA-binding transcriptional regulator YafY